MFELKSTTGSLKEKEIKILWYWKKKNTSHCYELQKRQEFIDYAEMGWNF